LWVIQVRPDGQSAFGPLDESVVAGLPVAGIAVVIDYCGEVRPPDQL